MSFKPMTVLDKTLRNGMRLELCYEHGGFHTLIDGKTVSRECAFKVRWNAVDLPDTPHVVEIPGIPGVVKEPGRFGIPVGLTDAEAGAVANAHKEFWGAPARRARAAAPDAPTWTLPWRPGWPLPGETFREPGTDKWVTVLRHKRWWVDDGRSFHLNAEEGYLYAAVVRAATEEEINNQENM